MDVQTNQSKYKCNYLGIKSKVIYHTYIVHTEHSQFDSRHLTVNSEW
jgi:hypothetical protein